MTISSSQPHCERSLFQLRKERPQLHDRNCLSFHVFGIIEDWKLTGITGGLCNDLKSAVASSRIYSGLSSIASRMLSSLYLPYSASTRGISPLSLASFVPWRT